MNTMDHYLAVACRHAAVVERTLAAFSAAPLAHYLAQLGQYSHGALQPRDDLGDVVYRYCAPLLGDTIAARARQDLEASPVVLTTNHHGADFFAQSVQGNLLFSMRNGLGNGRSPGNVLVFACGSVALNNLTYPRGVLCYGVPAAQLEQLPYKVPIFPDRLKREMVSTAPGVDATMLSQAEKRIAKLCAERRIAPGLRAVCTEVMQTDYGTPQVLAAPDYSRQAVLLNNRLWKRLFAKPSQAPELVYLEIEKITARLLEFDLDHPQSLAWRVMFDERLRESVLTELNGQKGCWDRAQLEQRLRQAGQERQLPANGAGTLFFWGIAAGGKRIPLGLERLADGGTVLCGVDERGASWQTPFTAAAVNRGLAENRLLPSLFTCFLSIALARGVNCVGGYYQAEYLPAMQRGVVAALCNGANDKSSADLVARVPTTGYLAGMQAVMVDVGGNALVPAGLLEIAAAGGLDDLDLERMLALSVRDAHRASLFETLPDVAPWETANAGWKTALATDCYSNLRHKVVVKHLP